MHLVMIGGSDAGISAALRARELDPGAEVSVVVADAYPNFSICGIPYYVSGEVTHWRNLAHRTTVNLEATGMNLRLDTTARRIDVSGRKLLVTGPGGHEERWFQPCQELFGGADVAAGTLYLAATACLYGVLPGRREVLALVRALARPLLAVLVITGLGCLYEVGWVAVPQRDPASGIAGRGDRLLHPGKSIRHADRRLFIC
jgi:NADPH-dependent 2,4-dienoyl-CoA reductase/sulfur reductase-like enzyme